MEIVKVYNLKSVDTDGATALLCEPHICERCKREHSKVYVVRDDEGNYHEVGKTCCKRLFGLSLTESQEVGLEEGAKLAEWIIRTGKTAKNLFDIVFKAYHWTKGYTEAMRCEILNVARKQIAEVK